MKKNLVKILSAVMSIFIIASTCSFAAVDVEEGDIDGSVFSAYVNDFVQGDRIRVNFSKAINTDTLAGNVKLFAADGTEIPTGFAAQADKMQIIVTPQRDIVIGKEYAVVLNGVKDADGNSLVNNSCYFKMDTPEATTASSYIYNEDFSELDVGTALGKQNLAVLADDGTGASIAADPVADGTHGNALKWQANASKVVIGGYGTVYKAWWDRNDYDEYASAKDIVIEFDTYIETTNNICSPQFKIMQRNNGNSSGAVISSIFFNTDGKKVCFESGNVMLNTLQLEPAYGRWVNVKAIRRFTNNSSTVEWYIDGKYAATDVVDGSLNAGTNLIYITQQSASTTKGVAYYDNIKIGYAEESFNTVGDAVNPIKLADTNGTREITSITEPKNQLVEIEFAPKPTSGILENKSAYLTIYSTEKTSDPKIMYAYVGADGSLGFYKTPFTSKTNHISQTGEVNSISSDANTSSMTYWYTAVDAVKANEKTNIKAYIDVTDKSVSYYVNNSFIGKSKTDDVNNLIPKMAGANVTNGLVNISKYSITPVKNNYVQKMRIKSGSELFGFKSDGIGCNIDSLTVEYLKTVSLDDAKILLIGSNGTETDVTGKASVSGNVITISDVTFGEDDYTLKISDVNDAEDYIVKFTVNDSGSVTASDISAVYSDGTKVENGSLKMGSDIAAVATVTNTKSTARNAVVINSQYNKDKTELIDAAFVNIAIPAGQSISVTKDSEVKLTTQISDDCGKISVFVWSGFSSLIPYGMETVTAD